MLQKKLLGAISKVLEIKPPELNSVDWKQCQAVFTSEQLVASTSNISKDLKLSFKELKEIIQQGKI